MPRFRTDAEIDKRRAWSRSRYARAARWLTKRLDHALISEEMRVKALANFAVFAARDGNSLAEITERDRNALFVLTILLGRTATETEFAEVTP